jgi:hypothetical protein
MTRASGLIAAMFVFVGSLTHAAPIAHAVEGETLLVLPFRAVGVGDATITAVRAVLSGELEARGFVLTPVDAGVSPAGEAAACDEMQCALVEAQRAGADRVVYGTLIRLGERTTVRIQSAWVGADAPYYRDQLTAPTEGDLPDLLAGLAGAIGTSRPVARRVEGRRHSKAAPRLGFGVGALYPLSDTYGGQTRLTSLRFYLRREMKESFVEMGIPFAGIAWSGGIVPADGEARSVDWTVYEIFAGKVLPSVDHPGHFGVGIGLHRLHFSHGDRITPQWKVASYGCGYDCGGDTDAMVVTGEVGFGARLDRWDDSDLTLSIRLRTTLLPSDLDDDAVAHGILVQLGVIL